jgi:hypothetical protein
MSLQGRSLNAASESAPPCAQVGKTESRWSCAEDAYCRARLRSMRHIHDHQESVFVPGLSVDVLECTLELESCEPQPYLPVNVSQYLFQNGIPPNGPQCY